MKRCECGQFPDVCARYGHRSDPVLPYDGGTSSGHSGTETSHERAKAADADGTTSLRQRRTLERLDAAWERGLTWRELAEQTGWHHGQASGVLTALHKGERIARLAETRDHCKVYVALRHVHGRRTEIPASRLISLTPAERDALIRLADVAGDPEDCIGNRTAETLLNLLNRALRGAT